MVVFCAVMLRRRGVSVVMDKNRAVQWFFHLDSKIV
jgi:hypothetical protein